MYQYLLTELCKLGVALSVSTEPSSVHMKVVGKLVSFCRRVAGGRAAGGRAAGGKSLLTDTVST